MLIVEIFALNIPLPRKGMGKLVGAGASAWIGQNKKMVYDTIFYNPSDLTSRSSAVKAGINRIRVRN